MTFSFAPAIRQKVSLIILLAGPTGSGKTFSALRLARGLAGGDDSKIAVLDTESGRALHYAVGKDEEQSADRFAFAHGDLRPPFTPEAYQEAIAAADKAGYEVIIVDSGSHEYDGQGGIIEIHDDIVNKKIVTARDYAAKAGWRFNEYEARDKMSLTAWNEPKTRNRKYVGRLLQVRAHLIICLRAEDKMRVRKEKDKDGREKTVFIAAADLPPQERWVPICEKRLPYEATASFVFSPAAPGVPIPLKLQKQHRAFINLKKPLDEAAGAALAHWAAGGIAPATERRNTEAGAGSPPSTVSRSSEEGGELELWRAKLAEAAIKGIGPLASVWMDVPHTKAQPFQRKLRQELMDRFKPIAQEADEALAADAEHDEEPDPLEEIVGPNPDYDTTQEKEIDQGTRIERLIDDEIANRQD